MVGVVSSLVGGANVLVGAKEEGKICLRTLPAELIKGDELVAIL